jgi:hypothetical protein
MNKIFASTDVGRKNIGFGIALFLILGIAVGVPLTIDLFGGTILSQDQYQIWKVVHGYGVFLAFINYFFGLCIDRLSLTRAQKEISSWSFLLAGVIGGLIRMILVLTSTFNEFGIYASLGESACFIVGTLVFVSGQLKDRSVQAPRQAAPVLYPHAK